VKRGHPEIGFPASAGISEDRKADPVTLAAFSDLGEGKLPEKGDWPRHP